MGIPESIIIASVLSAAASTATSIATRPKVPVLPPPPDEDKLMTERKRKIRESQMAAAQRISGLGTVQLKAPTLTF